MSDAPPRPRLKAVDTAAEERTRRRKAILEGPAARQETSQGPVLGIDFGTTACRAAVWLEGEVMPLPLEGQRTDLPAVVAFSDKGQPLVGSRAKEALAADPRGAVIDLKLLLGLSARSRRFLEAAARYPFEICEDEQGDAAVRARGRVYSLPQIASFLVAEIRGRATVALGCQPRRAVVGVPAWFNDRQRQAVRCAVQLAGLEVLRVVGEPTALAIAHAYGRGLTRKRLLVCDLGGGTLDLSVIEVTGDDLEVVAAGGGPLSGAPANDLAGRAAEALRGLFEGAGLSPRAVDEVLLAGGASRIPALRAEIEILTGRAPLEGEEPPSVATGAAIVGRALDGEAEAPLHLEYVERLASPIGIAARDGAELECVLDRGSPLPCEKTVALVADASGRVELSVLQGDPHGGQELLGKLVLDGPAGRQVDLRFCLSKDGLLSLSSPAPDGTLRPVPLETVDDARDLLLRGARALAAEEKQGLLQRLFGKK